MSVELDHFFVLAEPGAPEASALVALGLQEGTPNVHTGQGTANRRFFFSDAMLEFLYLRDPHEAMNGAAARLRLVERLSSAGASPFGIVLRTTSAVPGPPFPGWHYRPEYTEPDRPFLVGANSNLLEEPLCVVLPVNAGFNPREKRSSEPFASLTELRISVPVSKPSGVLQALSGLDRIRLVLGAPHCLELIFQHGRAAQCADLRPALPLLVTW
jgi:hypothetical protein